MLTVLSASFVFAQDRVCDPEYFESLKARAWLEAQREITQNQNLIFKPDSVFEYTCFDLYVNELADHAKDMFSETRRWGLIRGIHTSGAGANRSMDNALQALVGDALFGDTGSTPRPKGYIDQNFEYTGEGNNTYELLGGRANEEQDADGNVTENGIDYDFNPISGEPADGRNIYNCDIMNQVWLRAKCMDFIDNQTNDGFYTFEEYRDNDDKRFLPRMCERVLRWGPEINTATVNGDPPDGTPWEEDEIDLSSNVIAGNCAPSQTSPIYTGLKVRQTRNPREFNEAICIPAGCYFVPNAAGTGGSCQESPS